MQEHHLILTTQQTPSSTTTSVEVQENQHQECQDDNDCNLLNNNITCNNATEILPRISRMLNNPQSTLENDNSTINPQSIRSRQYQRRRSLVMGSRDIITFNEEDCGPQFIEKYSKWSQYLSSVTVPRGKDRGSIISKLNNNCSDIDGQNTFGGGGTSGDGNMHQHLHRPNIYQSRVNLSVHEAAKLKSVAAVSPPSSFILNGNFTLEYYQRSQLTLVNIINSTSPFKLFLKRLDDIQVDLNDPRVPKNLERLKELVQVQSEDGNTTDIGKLNTKEINAMFLLADAAGIVGIDRSILSLSCVNQLIMVITQYTQLIAIYYMSLSLWYSFSDPVDSRMFVIYYTLLNHRIDKTVISQLKNRYGEVIKPYRIDNFIRKAVLSLCTTLDEPVGWNKVLLHTKITSEFCNEIVIFSYLLFEVFTTEALKFHSSVTIDNFCHILEECKKYVPFPEFIKIVESLE